MKLDQIRLLVRDFPAVYRFYRDVLGLAPAFGSEHDTYASFATGSDTGLALFDASEMAEAIGTSGPPEAAVGRDAAAIVFEVDDVDATAALVTAAGGMLLTPPTDHPDWGIRTCHLRDPEGTLIEIETALRTPPGT
jgi:lactoylglutathione lyase